MKPVNWKDEFLETRDRVILTEHELNIPGLRLFGKQNARNALGSLVPHYHEEAFEFTFVESGMISFYANNKDYMIYGNSVFGTAPNEVHSTNNIPIPVSTFYWIQINSNDPNHFFYLNSESAAQLIQDLLSLPSHVIPLQNNMPKNALKYAFLHCLDPDQRRICADGILIFLEQLILNARQSQRRITPTIYQAIQYIETRLPLEEISLEKLADICALSESHFKQRFKSEVGISPRDYINRKRITLAKELLKDCSSITNVAMQLGFNNSNYFSSVFKKYTAISPSQYILKYKKSTEKHEPDS